MLKPLQLKLAGILALSLTAATPAFAGGFAAIVFNPATGIWGSFQNADSRADAEEGAMAQCGKDCSGVDVPLLESGRSPLRETWVGNGWASYATGGGKHWGTGGVHDSQDSAEASALSNCGAANGCTVITTVSSFDN